MIITELEYFINGLEGNKQKKGWNYPTTKKIEDAVCVFFGYSIEEIKGTDRQKDLILARHFLWYVLKTKRARMSYVGIAKIYGRNHATIIHAVNKIDNWINKCGYSDTIEMYNELMQEVNKKV